MGAELDTGPRGARWLGLIVGLGFAGRAALTGRRATHGFGRTVDGTVEFGTELGARLGLKAHETPCALRFSNLTAADDLGHDVRGLALTCYHERLDLVLNTGPSLLFWSPVTLVAFAAANALGRFGRGLYYMAFPRALENLEQGAYRAPVSFCRLLYYSQTPVAVELAEGRRLVRFRVRHVQSRPPGGREAQHHRPWDTRRLAIERGPADRLRSELDAACARGEQLRIEAQVAPDSPEFGDPGSAPRQLPWELVGTCRLTAPARRELRPVRFERLPMWWSVPRPRDLGDPASMGWLRSSIYRRARRARR